MYIYLIFKRYNKMINKILDYKNISNNLFKNILYDINCSVIWELSVHLKYLKKELLNLYKKYQIQYVSE